MTIRIKNWSRFQHFKDRRPLWVKLYRELLDDREWHKLDGDSAKMLVELWLLASESDGDLPPVDDIAFRLRTTAKKVNECLYQLSHWLETDRYQDDINLIQKNSVADVSDHLEKEKEKEKEKRESASLPKPRPSKKAPEDFSVTEDMAAWAKAEHPSVNVKSETAKFLDHTFDNARSDWPATWRNWIRRSAEFAPKSSAPIPAPETAEEYAARRKREIEHEDRKTAPIPANIREQIAKLKGTVLQ